MPQCFIPQCLKFNLGLAALCMVLITACASKPAGIQDEGLNGKLFTNIVSGDIRLFRFVVDVPEQSVRPITQRNQSGQRREALQDRAELHKKQLENIEKALKDEQSLTEFCPNGFTVIERYAVLNELVIRGECQYK